MSIVHYKQRGRITWRLKTLRQIWIGWHVARAGWFEKGPSVRALDELPLAPAPGDVVVMDGVAFAVLNDPYRLESLPSREPPLQAADVGR